MKKILICILVIHIFLMSTVLNAFAIENGTENNTSDTATAIAVNQTYNGNLKNESDVDFYRFEVYESGYFYVEMRTPISDSPSSYWNIYLYDSNESIIDGTNARTACKVEENGSTQVTNKYGVSAGTYYVKVVRGSKYSNGQYSINIKFSPANDWESENNSSKGNANLLEFNVPKKASLSATEDEDWFKFNVDYNAYIAIEFTHDAIDNERVYWKFLIQNSKGVNIHKEIGLDSQGYYAVKGNEDVTTHVYYLATGTYYIKVQKEYYSSAAYQIKVFNGSSSGYTTEKICIDSGHVVHFGHDNPYWRDVDKATCTVSGTREYYCDRCNVSIKTERVNATGHVATAWQDVVKPTCLASGIRQRVCEHCGILMEEEVVPETGHIYTDDDWVVVSGNKLIPPIIRERVCHSCEYVDRQEIWDYVWVPIVTLVAVVAVALGLINYIRAFLKKS